MSFFRNGVRLAGCWVGALCLALASASPVAAAKTDVVILENGDRITCEVKKLDRGKLTVKTDHMGTIDIEWDAVAEIVSNQNLEIEIETGEKFFGTLSRGDEGALTVAGEETTASIDAASVIRMVPIEASFWKRVDGSVDVGLSFTSSNDSTTFNMGSEVHFRTRKFLRRIGFDSTLIDQENAADTRRASLDAGWQRFLPKRRFTDLSVQFQENEELGLELRSLVKAVFGHHTIQKPQLRLDVFGGLAENFEKFAGFAGTESTELVAGMDLEFFRFDDPETDVAVDLFVFPSLSSSGRVRGELNVRLRREIVKDFFIALSVYDSYDSEPPRVDLPQNDWGFNTSLGWKF